MLAFSQPVGEITDTKREHDTEDETKQGELPGQHEGHEDQRGRVEHRIADPEGQTRTYGHVAFAQAGSNRRRAAGAHHPRQGDEAAEEGTLKPAAAEYFIKPLSRQQYLNERAEQNAQYRCLPYRFEVGCRVIERSTPRNRAGSVRSENGRANRMLGDGLERFSVVRPPLDIT